MLHKPEEPRRIRSESPCASEGASLKRGEREKHRGSEACAREKVAEGSEQCNLEQTAGSRAFHLLFDEGHDDICKNRKGALRRHELTHETSSEDFTSEGDHDAKTQFSPHDRGRLRGTRTVISIRAQKGQFAQRHRVGDSMVVGGERRLAGSSQRVRVHKSQRRRPPNRQGFCRGI